MAKRKALVAGGLGIVGRALVQHLETLDDWDIVALSRRAPDFDTRATFIPVDLTDRAACEAALGDLGDITHIFFAAVGSLFFTDGAPQPPAPETATNLDMVRNLVEVVEPQSSGIEHIQLIHGTKWYGNNFGPFKTPAEETDPRVMPPLFYYAQHDWLQSYQQDKAWSYSNLIPHAIYGFAVKSPYNHLMALALYACISRELGLPLRWAGRPGAFTALYQWTEAAHLAKGMVWAATTEACANETLNFTNGDYDRWCNIWPVIAEFFDMDAGPVQTISLAQMMVDKGPVWEDIRQRHGLRYGMDDLVDWRFPDWAYGAEFDQMSSMTKARKRGWKEVNPSGEMIVRLLGDLRRDKIIP